MSSRDPHQGKLVQQGPLAGHYRSGKIYKPRLISYEPFSPTDWIREDLPDLLWPATLATLEGHASAKLFVQAQERVLEVLGSGSAVDGPPLDGRLTSLERFGATSRQAIRTALADSAFAERLFPKEMLGVLQLYEDVPGSWLFVEQFENDETVPSAEEAFSFLLHVLVSAIKDGSVNALSKLPTLGWRIVTGTARLAPEVIDLLRDYPMDATKRPLAEATIRSSFLAMKAADHHSNPEPQSLVDQWSASFWRQNHLNTACVLEEAALPAQVEGQSNQESESAVDDLLDRLREHYLGFAQIAAAAQVETPRARHEVLTGFVSRAYRSLEALLRAPHMWTGEQASPVTRLLMETQIVIRWMLVQHDEEVFSRYQSYGLGKRKLLRQHVKTLLEQLGDHAPEMFRAFAQSLEKKTGGEWGEEFQEVSLDSTFAGLSVRQMAEQVGMLDEYRHIYQSASGIAHGEWWAIEDYAMQRCRNPLHLFHQVPSLEEFRSEPEFAAALINHFQRIIDEATGGLTADEDSGEPPTDHGNR